MADNQYIFASAEELINYRGLNNLQHVEVITPTPSNHRTITDKKGFIIAGVFILLFTCFLTHLFIMDSDIRRIFFPVDNCANFCGLDNTLSYISGVACSGKDYTDKPYLSEGRCVQDCNYTLILGSYLCAPEHEENNIFLEHKGNKTERKTSNHHLFKDLFPPSRMPSGKFIYVITLTLGICLIVISYGWPLNVFLWPSYLLLPCISVILIGRLIYSEANINVVFVFFVGLGLVTIIIASFLLYKHLFYAINKEVTHVVKCFSSIILFAIFVSALQFLLFGFLILYIMLLVSPSELIRITEEHYVYKKLDSFRKYLLVIVIFVINWAMHFVAGFHCMVVAGCVASWYFKKEKKLYVVFENVNRTLTYSIGTIALWAIFQPWIDILKYCFDRVSNICICCNIKKTSENLTIKSDYFSKHSLIETAIHGQSLLKSGKRATKITTKEKVLVGKFIINLIWLMPQFSLFMYTTWFTYLKFQNIDHVWIPFSICFPANLAIISVFLETTKIIANTLLLCYFEYKAINGNDAEPHYELENLETFIEKSVEVFDKSIDLIQYCRSSASDDDDT